MKIVALRSLSSGNRCHVTRSALAARPKCALVQPAVSFWMGKCESQPLTNIRNMKICMYIDIYIYNNSNNNLIIIIHIIRLGS